MSNRVELKEEVLEAISGGSIDFHPDTPTSKSGSIGLNMSFSHRYDNYDDVLVVFNEVYYSRQWKSIAERDQTIFNEMISRGVVH